ncbi:MULTISPECIES: hypothetical protein [unclassified Microbacterium]|uniref:hypothetical protein n=1 Tax=unclassified Microbacterium TaxID=2609290 RepID=UPI00214CE495|nr:MULTISPECIES: hypothetical protein [unclassified Microbacterium]MCR2801604.1 hypothetical protein [Microbacterium sp. zg.Y818]MCR2826615.1 hypothetical protein [Microbacterium sp. zg.Y909]WIM23122.1 hypothetical protein QNO21_03540 [Microbacterium sp. zg-Y818]
MVMFLLRALVFLASAALGLIVADVTVSGFQIVWADWWGFVVCIVIFAVLQSVLSPWIAKVARRYAPALLGGIGIISTLVALLVVVLLPVGGLRITGGLAWILAPVVVWVVTAVATVLLPMVFIRRKADERRDARRE